MSDTDQLRPAFDELRATVLPAVRPPGVSAVRQTVRHRRSVRLGGGAATVTVLAVIAAIVIPHYHRPASELATPISRTSPPGSRTSPSVSPSDTGSSTSVLSGAGPSDAPPAGKSTAYCPTDWLVDLYEPYDNGWVGLSARLDGADLSCSNGQIHVFWASYTMDGTGLQRLYQSEGASLDPARRRVQLHIHLARECDVAWYVVVGEMPILQTIRGTDGYRPQGPERGRIQYEIRTGCPSAAPGG